MSLNYEVVFVACDLLLSLQKFGCHVGVANEKIIISKSPSQSVLKNSLHLVGQVDGILPIYVIYSTDMQVKLEGSTWNRVNPASPFSSAAGGLCHAT